MKRLITIFLLISVCFSANSQDFRKASWGDSWAKVKASESTADWSEPDGDMDNIYYRFFMSEVGSLEAFVTYYFIQDSFVMALYLFMEEHINKNDYVDDFDHIKGNIEAKYGKSKVSYDWKSKPYVDDPERYGWEIFTGNLEISYTKETERTIIGHSLAGKDYQFVHSLRYESLVHSDLINRTRAKTINDIF